ncbi:small ribosomal subunit biogenesis GTPase RsgA [Marinobacteraceae bacterium S3BR75-40.1]
MAKRKLSKRQQWRIKKIQAERSERAHRKERDIDRQLQAGALGDEQKGLVIAHFGQQLDVEALEGEHQGELFRCHVRANIDGLVTGDKVIWRVGAGREGVIVAREERRSELRRPDNFGNLKPVAANIDQILLVIAPEPEPHANLIDRYLVAAEVTEIPPILVLNKADLLTGTNRPAIDQLLERYRSLGYQTLETSIHDDALDQAFREHLRERTSVFVGQSGVGKSSLIQALLPHESLKVGALSEGQRKGTHTTTTARLFHLPGSGQLIDSPGIREFGLWHITPEQLAYGFVDIRPLIGHCKFRNCSHRGDPGCALDAAVESGELAPERLESFRRILQDIEAQQARGLTL